MKKALILKMINKELKSDLLYILRMINHKKWFYTYESNYTKQELRDALKAEFFNADGSINFDKVNLPKTYRDAMLTVNEIVKTVIHNPSQTFMITKGFNCCDDLTEVSSDKVEIIKLKFHYKFRIFDDGGELYYEGYSIDNSCFNPLDDFGAPNAGATEIKYLYNGKFETL
jgi:hypothetical protein